MLTVAEMAGVMGAKRTSELIPLCHPIPLTDLLVEITPDRAGERRCASGRRPQQSRQTGVEMEALTAASGRRSDRLRHGQGRGSRARSSATCGCWRRGAASQGSGAGRPTTRRQRLRPQRAPAKKKPFSQAQPGVTRSALVLTISDGVAAGTRDDESGEALAERLTELGFRVERAAVPDEPEEIAMAVDRGRRTRRARGEHRRDRARAARPDATDASRPARLRDSRLRRADARLRPGADADGRPVAQHWQACLARPW